MKSAVSALDVLDQPLQRIATVEAEAALSFVGIGANDLDAALGGILLHRLGLVLGRVFLMLGGHPDVLRGANRLAADLAAPARTQHVSHC